ncbi:hypothetical protein GSS88_00090 [Corynebacterium sp. 3HC-13]|nr:hypothetical protein [Corynebacterium poyangense]
MRLSEAEKRRWAEIDAVIQDNKTQLKSVATHEQLKEFASQQGWMNKADFGKFKVSLRKLGIDYDVLRQRTFDKENEKRAERVQQLDDDAPRVHFLCAAIEDTSSGDGAFAIIAEDGEALWYGGFFEDDKTRRAGDLVSAEQSVAEKAVWFAHKCFEEAGHQLGRLELTTTCPELDIEKLCAMGYRYGIAVDIQVDDDDLRAVHMAEAPGYKNWQENNLADLVETSNE